MRKNTALKKITALILLVALTSALCGCGGAGEIKSLTAEFEGACNELDIGAMLDCINPAISDKIELAAEIAGMFTDKSSDELMESLAEFLTGDTTLNAGDFFSSIKINLGNIKIDGGTASADAEVEYTVGGESFEKEAAFEYMYEAEKWYISSFGFK